jgi:hypothetical protein
VKRKDDEVMIDMGLKEIKISEDKFSKHILCTIIDLDKRKHIFTKDD